MCVTWTLANTGTAEIFCIPIPASLAVAIGAAVAIGIARCMDTEVASARFDIASQIRPLKRVQSILARSIGKNDDCKLGQRIEAGKIGTRIVMGHSKTVGEPQSLKHGERNVAGVVIVARRFGVMQDPKRAATLSHNGLDLQAECKNDERRKK